MSDDQKADDSSALNHRIFDAYMYRKYTMMMDGMVDDAPFEALRHAQQMICENIIKPELMNHRRCVACRWYVSGEGKGGYGDWRHERVVCLSQEINDCVIDPPADFGCIHWKAKE
jgi:hypothetical protein